MLWGDNTKLRLGYIVFYSNRVKEGSAGQSNGPIILIRPEYKDDKGLEAHEVRHVFYWWIHGLIINSLLYKFCRKYRLWNEVRCYRKQLDYAEDKDQSRRQFAVRLATKYGLKIEIIEAFRLLG